MDYEIAKANLAKLAAEDPLFCGERNEATTRLQLIDELLFQCLGWERWHVVAEERFAGEYADYTLGDPTRLCIWEAKREGVTFELPAGSKGGKTPLKTLMEDKLIAAAIRQVSGYCHERGVPIGVVCNGHQIIAFLANRYDGVPPFEGKALTYLSLADMSARFRDLWDNLSSPGVRARNIYKGLQADSIPPPPEKLSLRIPSYPGFQTQTPFQTHLSTLASAFIEDIASDPEDEEEFLKACYAASGALSQYALVSRDILLSRYSTLEQQELEIPTFEAAADKNDISSHLAADLMGTMIPTRPIILMGDVGVGKTMFLRHLLKIDARDILKKSVTFYINFGKEPALESDLTRFVLQRCKEQLLKSFEIDIDADNFVRGVYHFELQRYSKTIYGKLQESNPGLYLEKEIAFLEQKLANPGTHLKESLEHITKAHGRAVVLFLDNIDQRPPEFQDQVFLIAASLASSWPATVFVSLRSETFYHSRVKGTLAAYQPRVFTISPPRIDEVVIKRLQYVVDQLKGTGRAGGRRKWLAIESRSLVEYLDALTDSFERSEDLMESLDNLSGGNVRIAIGYINAFVGSGHVNAEEILEKYKKGRFVVRTEDFMKAVILGDRLYYDPGSSPICNLFDVSANDQREHFLLMLLLAFIERSGGLSEGFVDIAELLDFALRLGFQPSQVHYALERAADRLLLDKSPRHTEATQAVKYRITTVSSYMIRRMVTMFGYIDAMVVDTPILDIKTRQRIKTVLSIEARVSRAQIFLDYLDSSWQQLSGAEATISWPNISRDIRHELSGIESRLPKRRPIGSKRS